MLLRGRKYDGATYLCGYVVELALKARICKTLGWKEYRTTEKFRSFRTHDLETLLVLSGVEEKITLQHEVAWSDVRRWTPETRYGRVGTTHRADAEKMLASAEILLRALT